MRNLDAFIGKNYKFKVIKFNKKRGNIVLSRRVLLEKERAELKEQTLEKLTEGQIVEGIVKNLTEYGAFIDLGGIDGLLHITDMSWGSRQSPSELFQVGDHVRVKVLKFNHETERVSLGLKQITEDPWLHASERYTPGTVVKGKVVSLRTTAPSSSWKKASRVWCTSARCRGPAASSTPRRWWRLATRSKPLCSTSTSRTTASRSA